MPRIIVQRRVIIEILPEVIEFRCDHCDKVCGTMTNNKSTINIPGGGKLYFCKKTYCWDSYKEEIRMGKFRDG